MAKTTLTPKPTESNRLLGAVVIVLAAVAIYWVYLIAFAANKNGCSPTCYISTAGSDANIGTSDKPWKTFANSLTALKPGDTLIVRGGNYAIGKTAVTVNSTATSTKPIVVKADPNSSTKPQLTGVLWITGANYWMFDGINVNWDSAQNVSDHMVKLNNSSNWVWKNSELSGAKSFAQMLVAGSSGGWEVAGNCIHDNLGTHADQQDHGIYVNSTGTAASSIYHNLIFNTKNGEMVKLGPPGSTGGPQNVTVKYNTFDNGYRNALVANDSAGNSFDHNIMTNPTQPHVRAVKLTQTTNSATNNLYFAATNLAFVLADSGYKNLVQSGNQRLDPQYDFKSCAGFHPQDSAAQGFGRYAG